MPLRKITIQPKKHKGIYEFYKVSDPHKQTLGYYFSYRDEFGTPKKPKLKATTKEDALAEANKIKAEVVKRKKIFSKDSSKIEKAKRNKTLTFNTIAEEFFDGRKVRSNSRDQSVCTLRLKNTIGTKLANKITKDDLEQLQDNLHQEDTLANKTINATVDLAINILNYAHRNNYIDSVVANRLPKDEVRYIKKLDLPSKTGRAFEDNELALLFDVLQNGSIEHELAPNAQLYLLCKLLYFSGARPEAILELQLNQYDGKKHQITIKAMKGISSYQQPLNDESVKLIEDWIVKYDLKYDHYLFFPMQTYHRSGNDEAIKKQGAKYEAIRGTARRYFDKLFNEGIPSHARIDRIGLYSLRRTGATKIYKMRGLVAASQFLHHTDVKTTMRYLDLKDDLKESINAL